MIPGSANPLLLRSAAVTGYTIPRSLRFNSSDSAYASRSVGTPTNNKIFTFSTWVKRSTLSYTGEKVVLAAGASSTGGDGILFFKSNNEIGVSIGTIGTGDGLTTTALFRDASAWYHIVVAVDTTQATSSNRIKLYVNGSQITTFSTSNYPSQNAVPTANKSGETQLIGRWGYSAYGGYFDGLLADCILVDGQQLTPSSFGEIDATTGAWNPKQYSGSYGAQGWRLDWSDNSNNTASTLGKDTSGLGNNWTPNNLSVTAGAGNDSLVDSPTNYGTDTGAGGEVRGNYCTLNPLQLNTITLANGNLDVNRSTGFSWRSAFGTVAIPKSGKWYFEATLTGTAQALVGLVSTDSNLAGLTGTYPVDTATAYTIYGTDDNIYSGPGNTDNGSSGLGNFTTGDVLQVLYDADNGNLKFGKNNTLMSSNAYTGLNTKEYLPVVGTYVTGLITFNFGQRPFAYTAPSGFKALCTANLPTPTIAKGSDYFDVKLYTGNGSTQTISGLNFSPDWVWQKSRTLTGIDSWHSLVDTVRGVGYNLASNATDSEYYYASETLASFNSDGFTVVYGTGWKLNASSQTYAAWCWDAGANSSKTYTVTVVSGKFHIDGKQQPTLNLEEGSTYTFDLSAASNSGHPFRLSTSANGPTEYTTGVTTSGTAGNAGATLTIAVASGAPTLYYFCTNHSGMGEQINTNTTAGASNFAGSITSSVRANASAGFSIVTYTGNGSSTDVTIGHGLGVAPQLVIVKSRGSASNGNWRVGHSSLATNNNLLLNTTDAQFSATSIAAGGGVATSHSSTTITLKAGPGGGGFNPTDYVNQNTITYVAYCFAPVAGYSSFGSYTGNGSADGPFVFCNFRPRWILIKNTSTTADWCLFDTARDTYNQALGLLNPNLSNAENILGSGLDILSNGFKLRRDASPAINNSANTFVYAAFAESPFAYARAR